MSNQYKNQLSGAILLFFIITLGNHLTMALSYEMSFDRHTLFTLMAGLSISIIPVLAGAYLLCLFPSFLYREGRLPTLFVSAFCLLPIFDLVYFSYMHTRFNWSVWHDLNYYAIKGTIFSPFFYQGQFPALTHSAILLAGVIFLRRVSARINSSDARRLLDGLLFAAILLRFLFPPQPYMIRSLFNPIHLTIQGKNAQIAQLGRGCLVNFFITGQQQPRLPFIDYNAVEKEQLAAIGLLPSPKSVQTSGRPGFKKIILLVFESMALEYLHSINPVVPPEATDCFDALMRSQPSAENFYCSLLGTLPGIYAILNSRMPWQEQLSLARREKSCAELFKEATNGQTFLIQGTSKHYGDEARLFKTIMGIDTIIAYEELKSEFKEPALLDWGFHDDVVLEKTLATIKNNTGKPFFIISKLIDQHQPPHFCGLKPEEMPPSVARHQVPIVRSLYWANYLLKKFLADIEKQGLFDEQTLLIITADHYPPPDFGHKKLMPDGQYALPGRLPLIFISKKPEAFSSFDSTKKSCQLDLAPTICYLTGSSQSQHFIGQNMIDANAISRSISYHDNTIQIISSDSQLLVFPYKNQAKPANAIEKWIHNLKSIP